MTKHLFTVTTPAGETHHIDMGYDRMCGHFFLQVEDPRRSDVDDLLYSTSYDPRFLMADRELQYYGGVTFEELERCCTEQGITPPAGLFENLLEDERLQRGNVITRWP